MQIIFLFIIRPRHQLIFSVSRGFEPQISYLLARDFIRSANWNSHSKRLSFLLFLSELFATIIEPFLPLESPVTLFSIMTILTLVLKDQIPRILRKCTISCL